MTGSIPHKKWKFSPVGPPSLSSFSLLLISATVFIQQVGAVRQAPLCIDIDNQSPKLTELENFAPIFKDLKKDDNFIPIAKSARSPLGFTKFHLTAIGVQDEDSGYNSILKNWVHITVEVADTTNDFLYMEGLYVQPIGAPFGIPFGEFDVGFDCRECSKKTLVFSKNTAIIPCMSRPALLYAHPNVFTFGGHPDHKSRRPYRSNSFHFHFKFTQYPGADITFFQFLVITVRSFKGELSRYEAYYTQIFEARVEHNAIGAYYPFYYGWPKKFVRCHSDDFVLNGIVNSIAEGSGFYKIMVSKTFDDCITSKSGIEVYTCPPGPVHMVDTEIPTTLKEWTNIRNSYTSDRGISKQGSRKRRALNESNSGQLTRVVRQARERTNIGKFCPDAGDITWNVGVAEWDVPDDLALTNGSIALTDILYPEDKPDRPGDPQLIDCETYDLDPGAFDYDIRAKDKCENRCHDSQLDEDCGDKMREYGNRDKQNVTFQNLSFSEQFDEIAWQWGEKYVLLFHGYCLIFSVTVGFNILAFVGRYMKETRPIMPDSGYFGIGRWLWIHMGVTYCVITSSLIGYFLLGYQSYTEKKNDTEMVDPELEPDFNISSGAKDLCNVRRNITKVEYCFKTVGHRYVGGLAVILFMMSYLDAWRRPRQKAYRNMAIIYHITCGYLSKIAGISSIIFSIKSIKGSTVIYMGCIEAWSLIFFIVAEVLVRRIDMQVFPKRKICPVIEAIEEVPLPAPYNTIWRWLLPVYIIPQITFFFMMVVQHYWKVHADWFVSEF